MNNQESTNMKITILFCFCIIFLTCSYDFPNEPPVQTIDLGSADFSNFVVIGSTWSGGYMDGALYPDAQKHSYPALVVDQINQLNEEVIPFVQPLIVAENGYDGALQNSEPEGRQVLEFLKEGKTLYF